MFSSAVKRLKILSPSSSTISYTVSNALPRVTRASQFLGSLGDALRVLLCIFVLSLDVAALHRTSVFPAFLNGSIGFQDSRVWEVLYAIVDALDGRVLASGSTGLLYLCLRKGYTGKLRRSGSGRTQDAGADQKLFR